MATHYTYAQLTTAIRNYTEVDANVLTQAIIDDFIMAAEHRINIDCPMDSDRFVQEGTMAADVNNIRVPAGTHPIGAKVFGAYKVDSLNETQVQGTGQPEFTTQFNGVNVTLASNATSTETGGGLLCTIGPINDRA